MLLRRKIQLTAILAGLLLPVGSVLAGNIVPNRSTARFYDTHTRINLGLSRGNVTVTDSKVTGYAWSESWGWIKLDPAGYGVRNDGHGNLSGCAWGENLGWVNFAPTFASGGGSGTPCDGGPTAGGVSIDSGGYFSGFAWSQNGGWIEFNCAVTDACVQTTWGVVDPGTPTGPSGPSGPTSPPKVPDPDLEPPVPTEPSEPMDPAVPPITDPVDPPGRTPPGDGGDGPIKEVETPGGDTPIDEPQPEDPKDDDTDPTIPGTTPAQTPGKKSPILKIIPGPVASAVVAIVGGLTGLSTMVASAFISLRTFGELVLLPQKIWSLLLAIFGFRKRRLPWGTVYDSVTKQPLDPAYVQLLEAGGGKEVEGVITDLDGRFGFLPQAGNYTMQAHKTNYSFPSKRLEGRSSDVLYDNLYFGGEVRVGDEDVAVIHNVPLDPVETDWNEVQKRKKGLFNFYSKYDVFIYSVSTFLFYLGLVLSIAMVILYPSVFHYVVAMIYAVLVLARALTSAPQKLGSLRYKNGEPVSYGLVKVYIAGSESEVKKVVANEYGKFYCLVAPASYYVKVFERAGEEEFKEIYTSPEFYAKNGLVDGKYIV